MTYISIGTITNTHGIKGALKVKTDSDFKEARYKIGNTVYIYYKNTYLPVTIEGHFEKKALDILTFKEFDTIEAVEKYKGCAIAITEADREPLEEDAFYYSDLIGLDVYTDKHVGTVKAIRDYPQGAMLIIAREGKKDAFVPFLKKFVKSVDDARITIIEMDGLL